MKLYEANPDGTKGRYVGRAWESSIMGFAIHKDEKVLDAGDERQALNELMAYDLEAVE